MLKFCIKLEKLYDVEFVIVKHYMQHLHYNYGLVSRLLITVTTFYKTCKLVCNKMSCSNEQDCTKSYSPYYQCFFLFFAFSSNLRLG